VSLSDPDIQRVAELNALREETSKADRETVTQLRPFLLDAMFPSMPDAVRVIVLPLFALVTLEVAAIDEARSRPSVLST
jgi:hypothetical protein